MGDEVRFAEAGRGCVAFEARADNDVTVVFKEHAGMFWMPQTFVTLNFHVHFTPPLQFMVDLGLRPIGSPVAFLSVKKTA